MNGKPLGNETFKQFEVGIRSSWFNHRLRTDLVYYRIDNDGMNVQQTITDENGVSQYLNYYFKGGHIRHQGIELDVTGRIYKGLTAHVGIARMESRYIQSTTFVVGSSPKNIPDFTANFHVNYFFSETAVKGLSLGAGFYYLGERPYNDWIQTVAEYHGITPGLKPWNLDAYFQLNAQIGYDFKFLNNKILKGFDLRIVANNLTNSFGYNAYRNTNINPIMPINGALIIKYRF